MLLSDKGLDLPFLLYFPVLPATPNFPTLTAHKPRSLHSFPSVYAVATSISYTWHTSITSSARGDPTLLTVHSNYRQSLQSLYGSLTCLLLPPKQNEITLASVFPQTFPKPIRALIAPYCGQTWTNCPSDVSRRPNPAPLWTYCSHSSTWHPGRFQNLFAELKTHVKLQEFFLLSPR